MFILYHFGQQRSTILTFVDQYIFYKFEQQKTSRFQLAFSI